MDYELAKELKDAGFPFKKSLFESINDTTPLDKNGTPYIIPTLSELLVAFHLPLTASVDVSYRHGITRAVWFATNWRNGEPQESVISVISSEDAVGRLWLLVNKK